MHLSLKQAAEATGKSKSTLLRAIQSGKMSGHRSGDGDWTVEPAELFRVYPAMPRTDAHQANTSVHGVSRTGLSGQNASLDDNAPMRAEMATLRELLAVAKATADERQATITDLRSRLDSEAEDRRRLTLLLTDRRSGAGHPSLWSRIVAVFRD